MNDLWLHELGEFISIPSVSADVNRCRDVWSAAQWVSTFLAQAGGESEVVSWNGQPLVIGEIPASRDSLRAPTVLVYGHFDVQSEGPADLWESDPYQLAIRDGWAYGRGVVDDKGSLYMLLRAAADLAAEKVLPVNVRFLCDGEEEILGTSVTEYLADGNHQGIGVCVIYDMIMLRRDLPSFGIGTRGNVMGKVKVRTGRTDLHSGAYGGAAMNAVHVLNRMLTAVCASEGHLPAELRKGLVAATDEELLEYEKLDGGGEILAACGATPADDHAAEAFHSRVRFEPTVEVTGIRGGSPELGKTIVPAYAEAQLSARLGAGQEPEVIAGTIERLLKAAALPGAEVQFECLSTTCASFFQGSDPAIQLACDAFERVFARRPLLIRAGETLPIMPALQAVGIPAVLTGFGLPDSNIHAPNERLLAQYIAQGIDAAKELFGVFRALPA